MRQLYLLMLAVLLSFGTQISAQSFLSPSEGFGTDVILPENTNFSVFDIHDNILLGLDGDTIRCYDMNTWEQVEKVAKPADYDAYPSFIKMIGNINSSYEIWMGFTVAGNTDDRIYRYVVNSYYTSWWYEATLAGNYDLEFFPNDETPIFGKKILVSGLNNTESSTPNAIFQLDTLTGLNQHKKIIEIGGYSAGFTIDAQGDLYYGTAMGNNNALYRWDSLDIANRLVDLFNPEAALLNDSLIISDATKLCDLPSGASDCEIDEAGNLLFACNDFSGDKFIGKWNGTEGEGANYDIVATSSAWLSSLQSVGNFLEYNEGHGLFANAYAQPIAKLFPNNPIQSTANLVVSGNANDDNQVLNLADYFTPSDENATLTYELVYNSVSSVANATIDGTNLTIEFLSAGQTNIGIKVMDGNIFTIQKMVVGVSEEISDDNCTVSNFEDLSLEENSYWNGSDESGFFVSGLAKFKNNYNATYGSWSGWAYSNTSDVTTAGYANQFSAITGEGFDASNGSNYGVASAFSPNHIVFNDDLPHQVKGLYITNSTYVTLSMENGDSFAKKFGGADGNDPDYFKLLVWGKHEGAETDTVEYYLADFRFEDNTQDYIIKTWQWLDLSSLGTVDTLFFGLESSDVGQYGMNTPAYFDIDNLYIEEAELIQLSTPFDIISDYENADNVEIDLSSHFISFINTPLSYEVVSSMPSVASANVENNNLTIDLLSAGQTNINVTATAGDYSITETIIVGVYPEIASEGYTVSNFDDLSLEENSYWNGSDESGFFVSGLAKFKNYYNPTYFSWSGWAYSNTSDVTTAGYANQYSAITGEGFDASNGSNYGVAFVSSYNPTPHHIAFSDTASHNVKGFYITNSTYATLSMENGDDFAKKFGGADGNDPDYFKLLVWGKHEGAETDTVEYYLADFRFEDNTQDYIIKTWQWLDLSSLGTVDTLFFGLESSDVGQYGMNTPAYFDIDNLYIETLPNAIVNISDKQDLRVYPNPSNGIFELKADAENYTVRIFNANGSLVYTKQSYNNDNQVDISNQPAGLYLISVEKDGQIINKTIIKE